MRARDRRVSEDAVSSSWYMLRSNGVLSSLRIPREGCEAVEATIGFALALFDLVDGRCVSYSVSTKDDIHHSENPFNVNDYNESIGTRRFLPKRPSLFLFVVGGYGAPCSSLAYLTGLGRSA